MEAETLIRVGQQALLLVLLLSAPAVLATFLVALVVSLLQAATQVQEHTLPVAPKLAALYAVILTFGLWSLGQLMSFAMQLLEGIGEVGR